MLLGIIEGQSLPKISISDPIVNFVHIEVTIIHLAWNPLISYSERFILMKGSNLECNFEGFE